jgi:UDP-N-acetylmuramate dehydrogenase
MRNHTSFKIGGPVSEMWLPKSDTELRDTLALLHNRGVSPLLIGRGTNLLVSDSPLDIVVVKTYPELAKTEVRGNEIYAQSGAALSAVAALARDNSLTGLEFAHGIPGSLGGAIFMNAGAYGGDMAGVVTRVDAFDSGGELLGFTNEQCEFSYRNSIFSVTGDVILAAKIQLEPGDADEISAKMREFAERRRESQPLEFPSAGSAFKRPPPKNGEPQYAAQLIDAVGLRGYRVGGAAVSDKHAGFIVNLGGATCDDVLRVIEHVRNEVLRKFSVELEPEIKIVK